jgi:TPR repeat protein
MLLIPFAAAQANEESIAEAKQLLEAQDYKQALLLLKPLAKQGNPKAQYLLGRMYSNGEGVTKNPDSALKWLKLAAEQNHLGAANTLGKMYASGLDVPQDDAEATKWFTLAAQIADATGEDPEDCE